MLEAKLSPSMMCADIFNIGTTVRIFEHNNVPFLHIDVMDGTFVPNIMLGTSIVEQLRAQTSIPLDIHLMVEHPDEKIQWFNPQPNDLVSVHAETTPHLQRVLAKIRSYGARSAVGVNPATPLSAVEEVLPDVDAVLVMTVNPGYSGQKLVPQTLDKIARLRNMLDARGCKDIEIEVDGNVSLENAVKMRKAGANIFVVGSSLLFRKGGSLEEHIAEFNRAMSDCS
jgi:ribulose-phosphate 3-epimerase